MATKKGSAKAKKAWATRRRNAELSTTIAPFKEDAPMSLYAQLDDALAELEARIAGTIKRIKAIGV